MGAWRNGVTADAIVEADPDTLAALI